MIKFSPFLYGKPKYRMVPRRSLTVCWRRNRNFEARLSYDPVCCNNSISIFKDSKTKIEPHIHTIFFSHFKAISFHEVTISLIFSTRAQISHGKLKQRETELYSVWVLHARRGAVDTELDGKDMVGSLLEGSECHWIVVFWLFIGIYHRFDCLFDQNFLAGAFKPPCKILISLADGGTRKQVLKFTIKQICQYFELNL